MPQTLFVFLTLALTQVTAWGAVGFLPAIGSGIATDLGTGLPRVFLGSAIMFVTTGLVAPWAGRGFARFGARRMMAVGAALVGLGLALAALAPALAAFLAAWVVIGAGGALVLTTGAYVYLADWSAPRARSLIATMMLVTGLAGSIFWPVSAYLDTVLGWRGALFVYAAVMALAVAPWLLLLPEPARAAPAAGPVPGRARRGPVFWFLVTAVALNGFVTFGIDAIGIELFRALGQDLAGAVALASALGFIKVGGRVIDLLGGSRWDALGTGLVAGAMIPVGLLALALGGGSLPGLAGYLVFFGLGCGAYAVARATMPLVFYQKADYAAAMATIALPLNLINGLAAPLLATALAGLGPRPVLVGLALVSTCAFLLLVRLNRLRAAPAGLGAPN